ncbi:hypothetical protein NLS1_41420 [Nocardioides sp. LS1]|nr:hypothetical protein NLS1_41420 [Nocardioides sp. LS1]
MQVRPFIERCPHSASVGAASETTRAVGFARLTANVAGVEEAVDPADLSPYLASRIARIAASLLIVGSPDEL